MIRIITVLLFGLMYLPINAQLQEKGSITLGKNYSIASKVLNETRDIQIYIPTSYKDSITKVYPVIYVLDGQDFFNSIVSFQRMLIKREYFPEFIVIGIQTDLRKRRTLLGKDSSKFIQFLENELIQLIDNNYRTSREKERIFFGWEIAGGIGVDVLANNPTLFSGYILPSPSNLWDFRLNALEKRIQNFKSSNVPFLLVTAAPEESWLNENKQLRSFFTNKKKDELKWRYSILEREQHHSTPYKTINEGIIDYFYNYNPITFRTLKKYEDFGGLKGLKAFYKKRGERFNVSTEISETTKMFILYSAVIENNYKQFLYYENAFDGHIETNTRDSWFHRYAAFYLKHNNTKEALYFYNYGLKKLGESKLLYRGLGDVYAKMNKKGKARKAYKKALSIDSKYKRAIEGLQKL